MILILSTSGEYTTDIVIDWLDAKQQPWIRINDDDIAASHEIVVTEGVCEEPATGTGGQPGGFTVNGEWVALESIKTVWFRKYGFYSTEHLIKKLETSYGVDTAIHLQSEYTAFARAFAGAFDHGVKWLTDPSVLPINKITTLRLAKSLGLDVPRTLLTNSKAQVEAFVAQVGPVITKCTRDMFGIKSRVDEATNTTYYFTMYTQLLTAEIITQLPAYFLPSTIQEYIDKAFEIRCFYLDGAVYSMAIFSQDHERTKLDFRKYDVHKPNRMVPFVLPAEVSDKLCQLMTRLGLNTGSIDFMVSASGKYYFLEVNPTGQFGFLSTACNYGLEEKVADYLMR
ncbi:grasp-with-spasm system ATP-grasp peptide maturase [Hymenobacter sp. 15J16-1T3B]|uniref:grasp-with-spasm system ATP-grasp peptide maturase n=1 Tax=Hymenobacter sp. 15J16-1T3B TaxID=2886941 RepID=UPI001D12681A|nr:grasp-with-spasm system ATP-grasp peptide maturase [Hymenobacter sp. 15J16-1T3B]MCC3157472.1 grasp-with-spasm system ATP-grasp peptide maturase [Hymenobacter sp. 15J16-1T3B]